MDPKSQYRVIQSLNEVSEEDEHYENHRTGMQLAQGDTMAA